MKRKKIILSILIGIGIISVLALIYSDATKAFFIITFNKSGTIGHVNANGKFDGELDIYRTGKLSKKANFKNGVLDGWVVYYYGTGAVMSKILYKNNKIDSVLTNYYDSGKVKSRESFKNGKLEGPKTTYYQNGQIEQKSFRTNNKVEGPEYVYYENGNLKYKRNWVNNKLYGDFYYFNKNKEVEVYHAYDILGDKFYLCRYGQESKISKSDGNVFSSRLYTLDNDSTLVLRNGNTYKSLKDLYITVANPPKITTEVQISINNKICKDLTFPNSNTVKIKNAFNHTGPYNITVEGIFVGQSGVTDHTVGKLSIIVK